MLDYIAEPMVLIRGRQKGQTYRKTQYCADFENGEERKPRNVGAAPETITLGYQHRNLREKYQARKY